MRAFIACLLVAAVAAQPPTTTTPKPNLLSAVGHALTDTVDAVGNQLETYVESTGKSLLHDLLPNLFGQLLTNGLSSLLSSVFHTGTTAAPTAGKRETVQELQQWFETLTQHMQAAEHNAGQLGNTIKYLLANFLGGTVSLDEYKQNIPLVEAAGKKVLADLKTQLEHDLLALMGNKRQVLDLSVVTNFLTDLETQGAALLGQVTNILHAFANPHNLLSLFGDVAQALTQ